MKNIFLFLGVCVLAAAGCATMERSGFYGVKIDQMSEDHAFKISGVSGAEVQHTFTKTMSKEVTAWADIKGMKIYITVINSSGRPLMADYFFDKFTIVAKDKQEYQLRKETETIYGYRSGDSIKPGGKALFVLSASRAFAKDEVEKIVCQIGLLTGARIVLKPLP